MKLKNLICVLAGITLVGTASAVTLNPGDGIISVGEVNPVGATTLFSTNVAWSAPSFSFSGELVSSVLTNDSSNPFGGLTFTYQFFMDTNSAHSASQLSIGDFESFLTDASYLPGSGKKPTFFGRSDESVTEGDTIQFSFLGALVPPGTNSALLVVQTDAHAWAPSVSTITDSQGVPNIATLAPVDVVPEPATFALAGVGVAAFACLKRRQNIFKRVKKGNTEKEICLKQKG